MILLDTAPLVALCDPRDRLNRPALRDLDRLSREPLVLCAPVLTETCFLLPNDIQRKRLRRLLAELSVRPYESADEGRLWSVVFDWMARYHEHQPDWADAYLSVVAGTDRRFKLWTYDREFRTIWRRPDGTAIPLAVRR